MVSSLYLSDGHIFWILFGSFRAIEKTLNVKGEGGKIGVHPISIEMKPSEKMIF